MRTSYRFMVYGAKPLHTPDSANKRIYLHKQLMVSAPIPIAPRQHSVDHSPPGAAPPKPRKSCRPPQVCNR